jgi:hypothetical protein
MLLERSKMLEERDQMWQGKLEELHEIISSLER